MITLYKKIRDLLNRKVPIIIVEAEDERIAYKIVKNPLLSGDVLEWSVEGFKEGDNDDTARLEWSLEETLRFVLKHKEKRSNTILVLRDAHPYLYNSEIVALLKLLAQKIKYDEEMFSIVIIVPEIDIPKELEKYIYPARDGYLSVSEIKELLKEICWEMEDESPGSTEESILEKMCSYLKGLTECDIRYIMDDWLLDCQDKSILKGIILEKEKIISHKAVLNFIPVDKSTVVYGQRELTDWLQRKAECFSKLNEAKIYGVNIPRGVLITGMPGSGKSINAYLAANLFDLPLIQLDLARLINSYYLTEQTRVVSKSIEVIEALAPCILWIDDFEKMYNKHAFSMVLEWLQKKNSPIFVVATVNEIPDTSVEIIRKCNFDEVFFVDLPDMETRQKIFEKCIREKSHNDLSDIDTNMLAGITDGYCGADIETVVNNALEKAFIFDKHELTEDDLCEAINQLIPLKERYSRAFAKMEKVHDNYKFKDAR